MTHRAATNLIDVATLLLGATFLALTCVYAVQATGCGAAPAYSVGLIAAAASHEDLLPKTGGFSSASARSQSASTVPPTQPPATQTQRPDPQSEPERPTPPPRSPEAPPAPATLQPGGPGSKPPNAPA